MSGHNHIAQYDNQTWMLGEYLFHLLNSVGRDITIVIDKHCDMGAHWLETGVLCRDAWSHSEYSVAWYRLWRAQ